MKEGYFISTMIYIYLVTDKISLVIPVIANCNIYIGKLCPVWKVSFYIDISCPAIITFLPLVSSTDWRDGHNKGYRIRTQYGKPWKVWNWPICFSRSWKVWNSGVRYWKVWNFRRFFFIFRAMLNFCESVYWTKWLFKEVDQRCLQIKSETTQIIF